MSRSLFLGLLLSGFAWVARGLKCRCLSSDPCWPSETQFTQLASRLSQPLVHPEPPESACYPVGNPSGNCTDVMVHATDGIWRATQPGSMQNPNYESYLYPNGTISACYLNTTLGIPCQQGSVPVLGVDARTVGDVQAAVQFAKKHNLRIVVKGTGHDYLGRSTGKGAFLIWTHNFQDITYNDAFVPKGGPPGQTYQAMTLGAGVQWRSAYQAIQAHGRVLVGGGCDTVGAAGGWVLGGGHSILAPTYGLGVDNVLEFSLVTSEGQFLVVNAYNHPELFWALRGGGGGTFGIVLSATYKTHGPTPLVSLQFLAVATNSITWEKFFTEFIRISPSLSDAGWAMYVGGGLNTVSITGVGPGISWAQANATWEPFFTFAQNLQSEGLQIVSAAITPSDSWYTWYTTLAPKYDPGSRTELISRFLSRDLVINNLKLVVDTLTSFSNVGMLFVAGGAVSKVDPNATAANPNWRTALCHLLHVEVWPDGADVVTIENNLRANLQTLAAMDPNAGAYLNEASLYEKDFRTTFFGSHYPALKSIKKIYDPSDMFVVPEGVGSEDWDPTLSCRIS